MLKNNTVSKDASSHMVILHGRGTMPRVGLNPAKLSIQGHPHKTSKNQILFNRKGRYPVCLYFLPDCVTSEPHFPLPHTTGQSILPRRANANRLGSSTLSSADLILQPEECRKPHGTRGRADHI
jgi:hypothetical protein